MPSKHKIDLGKEGEDIAAEFLIKKNFNILERNYRYGHGEIDIIAEDGETLVFVEVKTRNTLEFGHPEISVTKGKLNQIKKIAEAYLFEKEIDDKECRLDVVAILKMSGVLEIKHIENAYLFM